MEYILKKAKNGKNKFVIYPKKIYFGAYGYEDYTIHKDKKRKENYIKRHKKNENWNDLNTAGFWAKNILWNKTTIKKSVADINKRFGVNVKIR